MCSKVITTSGGALPPRGQSWLAPNGTTISTSSTASLSSINRVATGNYTCVTKLVTNANGVTNVNVSTLVVVYCECPPYWRNMFPYVPLVPTDPPTVLSLSLQSTWSKVAPSSSTVPLMASLLLMSPGPTPMAVS